MFTLKLNKTANVVSLNSTAEELQSRVDGLNKDEAYVYEYLRRYYSRRWIAETLFISKAQLRDIIKNMCLKLGVSDVKSMLRIYGRIQNKVFAEPINAVEIDEYVDIRSENEIRKGLG